MANCPLCNGTGHISPSGARKGPSQTSFLEPCDTTTRALARRTDPSTSRDAARKLDPDNLGRQQRRVLVAICVGVIEGGAEQIGVSDEDIYEIMDGMGFPISRSGARTRRSELREMDLVEQRPEDGKTEAGNRCSMWGPTPRGMNLYSQIEQSVWDEAFKRGACDG